MKIREWPQGERPREKLLAAGAASLSDAELLAIFLRTGVKGHSALDVARKLLREFGGIRGILASTAEDFCRLPGLGVVKYVQLQAALELSQRHLQESLKRGDALTSPKLTRLYLRAKMRNYCREVFCCIFLDNQHRVLALEELFQGTIDGSTVHPREVVRRGLEHNSAAVIFAHNHPSGLAEPSRADINITQTLKRSLALVDIRVLDHLVVGDSEVVSLAERGLM